MMKVLEECASEQQTITRTTFENDEEQQQHSNELETAMNQCANRVARLISDLHTMGDDTKQKNNASDNSSNSESSITSKKKQKLFDQNNQLARGIARECIVLLQNKDDFLPLFQREQQP